MASIVVVPASGVPVDPGQGQLRKAQPPAQRGKVLPQMLEANMEVRVGLAVAQIVPGHLGAQFRVAPLAQSALQALLGVALLKKAQQPEGMGDIGGRRAGGIHLLVPNMEAVQVHGHE